MVPFSALLDACVLYPAPLRDLLIQLGASRLFRARWTDAIHDEWIRNLLKNRPDIQEEKLARTRELMNKVIDDCLIDGYRNLIPSLELPDPDDRHILAAAIVGRVDVIVTYNLDDFPDLSLKGYGIEAQHPDAFIHHLLHLSTPKVCRAARQIRQRLDRPPISPEEYLDALLQAQLIKSVDVLWENSELL